MEIIANFNNLYQHSAQGLIKDDLLHEYIKKSNKYT